MSDSLKGKTAIVTGAGRGIGKAIAEKFASEGAFVYCLSRNPDNANATAKAIINQGGEAQGMPVDVSNPESVKDTIDAILGQAKSVDVIVNNAGVTRDGLLMRMSDDDWEAVIQTNLKGAFLVIRALTRALMKQKSGSIINVASVVGLTGNAGQANYAASKAGLVGLTKSTAKELASRGIRVNAIAPGFIRTDMTDALNEKTTEAVKQHIPLGHFGAVEDIAEAALYLAGDKARYVTGHILTVDGGMAM